LIELAAAFSPECGLLAALRQSDMVDSVLPSII